MSQLMQMKKFQTKKKSSDTSSWVAWASILIVGIVLSATMSLVQIRSLQDYSRLMFFNIRIPTIKHNDDEMSKNDSIVTKDTPMLFFGTEHVVLGTVSSIIAPAPNSDSLLMTKANWKQEIVAKTMAWRKLKQVFPMRVVAIATDNLNSSAEVMEELNEASKYLALINKQLGQTLVPNTFLVNFKAVNIAGLK